MNQKQPNLDTAFVKNVNTTNMECAACVIV